MTKNKKNFLRVKARFSVRWGETFFNPGKISELESECSAMK